MLAHSSSWVSNASEQESPECVTAFLANGAASARELYAVRDHPAELEPFGTLARHHRLQGISIELRLAGNPLEGTEQVRYFGVMLAARLPFYVLANECDFEKRNRSP